MMIAEVLGVGDNILMGNILSYELVIFFFLHTQLKLYTIKPIRIKG